MGSPVERHNCLLPHLSQLYNLTVTLNKS
jgi:hypothetical protein